MLGNKCGPWKVDWETLNYENGEVEKQPFNLWIAIRKLK